MERLIRTVSSLRDPRYYQVFVLSLLVSYGILVLDFGIHFQTAGTIFLTAQLIQAVCSRLSGLSRFDPFSALVTSLSLTMLLRTDSAVLAMLAAAIAISSKFLIRARGKHVFNPANIALVLLSLLSDHAWISSGQWGNTTIGALAVACLGLLVLTRARRAETTFAFLAGYAVLLFGRATWLHDPFSIPLHQLQNGTLLIFAFFMISDPKTTPDSAVGRIAYGAIVASAAYVIQFVFYEPNGPILALILSAPCVPLMDMAFGGRRYQWTQKENINAITDNCRHGDGDPRHHVNGTGILRLLRRPRGHEPVQPGFASRTRS